MNFSLIDLNFHGPGSFLDYIKGSVSTLSWNIKNFWISTFTKQNSRLLEKERLRCDGEFFKFLWKNQTKLYVIIDEYDNFANTILSTKGEEEFQTHHPWRRLFTGILNVLKGGTTEGSARFPLFMTGVSPITLDDVTSGFNIASNISLNST